MNITCSRIYFSKYNYVQTKVAVTNRFEFQGVN